MQRRAYAIYDVFTSTALAGNPLAVIFDTEGLDTAAMQAIAREFNLSETVFICPARNEHHTAELRIFMPTGELPFAGHPTVGGAIAIAERKGLSGPAILTLEEKVGLVRVAVKAGKPAMFAEFDLPRLPQELPAPVSKEAAAAALGLGAHEIGFENHVLSCWSAGVTYVLVPVHGLDAAARARLDTAAWLKLFDETDPLKVPNPYVYCRETVRHDSAFHARMFAGHHGIPEDPATGSAAAAFIGAIAHFDQPTSGLTSATIEQGIEMGRPSYIRAELEMEGGKLAAARIGGHAIRIAEGFLSV